jgi:hypothetical protein
MTGKDSSIQKTAIYAVDRREAGVIVLVDDSGTSAQVEVMRLPPACRPEGAVLRVPLDSSSQPIWENASRDMVEEERRLQLNAARLAKLRRQDAGGDVSL